jgi:hypothetical protein
MPWANFYFFSAKHISWAQRYEVTRLQKNLTKNAALTFGRRFWSLEARDDAQ